MRLPFSPRTPWWGRPAERPRCAGTRRAAHRTRCADRRL